MINKLEISYNVWKSISQNNNYINYHVIRGSNSVNIVTGNRDYVFYSRANNSDYTDWNTNFGSTSSAEISLDDATAKVVGLSTKATPKSSDGRQIFMPSVVSDDLDVCFSSCGDDVTNGVKLCGTRLQLQQTDSGTNTFEWQYITKIYINGGNVVYNNAIYGDYIKYEIYAPATVGTQNVGAGAYDKYSLGGGANMFIPNGTTEGDWDLNLTEKLNSNVDFTKVVPIPASDNDGYFDYDEDTELVTLNATGTGNSNLFDFDFKLIEFINDVGIMGTRYQSFTPGSYGAKKLQPHYKHKVSLYRSDTGTVSIVWNIFIGRVDAR